MENDKSGIRISWTILITVVAPIIVAYGTGVWFMADLTDNVKRQSEMQVTFDRRLTDLASSFDRRMNDSNTSLDHRISTDEDKFSNNKDQFATATNTINDRLTRIEAQLAYLVKTTTASPGR